MNGEQEERPGREPAIRAAKKSVEAAKKKLAEAERESARREWSGWLVKLRENRLFRGPVKRLASLFLGVPLRAMAADPGPPPEIPAIADASFAYVAPDLEETVEETDAEAAFQSDAIHVSVIEAHQVSRIEEAAMFEATYPETDQFYLWNLAVIAKTVEGGQAAPEYYARVGLPEWTPYQRALFADAPISERFTELHTEYRDLSPERFIASYPEMLKAAKHEFRFSNQFRAITEDATRLFAQEAPEMDPAAALEQYKILVDTMGREIGIAQVVKLTNALANVLPEDHPIRAYAHEIGMAEVAKLVGRSKKNIVHLDQARGELRVLRHTDGLYILIDTFPAIGGNLGAPELSMTGAKTAGGEFVHVPDTAMTVAYVDRAKTSWSWVNSWVPQGAPIRDQGDELQYQNPRTHQWYDLTGPNAAFFPDRDGKTITPFDARVEPMDIGLIRAATHHSPDGGQTFVPKAWTREELMDRNGGAVPTEWEWNDFGSMAIRLSVDGRQTNINIHSKPGEDIDDFLLGRTHGCFATYGDYVKALPDTYGVGSGSEVIVTTKPAYNLDQLRKGK